MPENLDRLIELDQRDSTSQQERLELLSLTGAVIDALPDGLVVSDADGNIILFNTKCEFMFGRHRSEVIGQKMEILVPERVRALHAGHREMFNRFDVRPHTRTMGLGLQLTGLRSDGHEFPVDITVARMVVPKGVFDLALVRYSHKMLETAEIQKTFLSASRPDERGESE